MARMIERVDRSGEEQCRCLEAAGVWIPQEDGQIQTLEILEMGCMQGAGPDPVAGGWCLQLMGMLAPPGNVYAAEGLL